ncbi:unnamed protein product [Protopolystoma xenopodis]|uniref:Uncharacterized protein n=1 Tax=Protopolystoma xenopodis TaxID=117903 RepID=A0A3S5AAY6_9PLAT|nr:unnamed protein product [Protopolystoma xenopodis]
MTDLCAPCFNETSHSGSFDSSRLLHWKVDHDDGTDDGSLRSSSVSSGMTISSSLAGGLACYLLPSLVLLFSTIRFLRRTIHVSSEPLLHTAYSASRDRLAALFILTTGLLLLGLGISADFHRSSSTTSSSSPVSTTAFIPNPILYEISTETKGYNSYIRTDSVLGASQKLTENPIKRMNSSDLYHNQSRQSDTTLGLYKDIENQFNQTHIRANQNLSSKHLPIPVSNVPSFGRNLKHAATPILTFNNSSQIEYDIAKSNNETKRLNEDYEREPMRAKANNSLALGGGSKLSPKKNVHLRHVLESRTLHIPKTITNNVLGSMRASVNEPPAVESFEQPEHAVRTIKLQNLVVADSASVTKAAIFLTNSKVFNVTVANVRAISPQA